MIHKDDSIEVRYGWVVLAASLAIHSIGLGAPTILFVTLKPIAADLGTARACSWAGGWTRKALSSR
jgi:hypothetical protein